MRRLMMWALAAALIPGCYKYVDDFPEEDLGQAAGADGAVYFDTSQTCTDTNADADNDKIPNGEEGCLLARDTDNDRTPDFRDLDSDNDKLRDDVEAGEKNSAGRCKANGGPWPCDTDGDRLPDYLDGDSDGDGLLDGEEDVNGDGFLGCCLTTCGKPSSSWQQKNCKLTPDGCGGGQKCVGGACQPGAAFGCSEGETSPKWRDTFGDGRTDNERGTFICRDATEAKPLGRKAVVLKVSPATRGDWHIALEKTAKYGEPAISNPGPKMALAVIDHDRSDEQVAGFILSRDTQQDSVQSEVTSIVSAIQASVPGGGTAVVRASGAQGLSHDLYDSVKSTIIDAIVGAASPVKLDYVPISSSLAVALDAKAVARSRSNGFDYRSAANSVVFINVKYNKGSEIIASYKRWERQTVLN